MNEYEPEWTNCPECHYPHVAGSICGNPACVASGNVPPEILTRRARELAEENDREKIRRIRERVLSTALDNVSKP